MKEVLNVCRDLTRKIEQEVERLQRLKTLATNITARLDGMPPSPNPSQKVENLATMILDSENRIKLLHKVRSDCMIELSAWLDGKLSDSRLSNVMFLRYGMCMSFSSIAKHQNYSERTIFRLHAIGFQKLSVACQY